jgi:hypothetical protein
VCRANQFPQRDCRSCIGAYISDKTVAAYARTTFFDRRRKLMQAGTIHRQLPADVVPLRSA